MKYFTQSLIRKVKEVSQIENESIWYFNEFNQDQEHPWEKFINLSFMDLNIKFPSSLQESEKALILNLIILNWDYDLVQGCVPDEYRLKIEDIGLLDELNDIEEFEIHSLARLIKFYFQANQKNEIQELENFFYEKIHKWNFSNYVKQEEVKSLTDKYSLEMAAQKAKIPADYIPQILSDYYSRIKRNKLDNLDSFFQKIETLYEANKGLKKSATFFNFILQEIQNGGANLNTPSDILPLLSTLNYN